MTEVFLAHGAWEGLREKFPIQETLIADLADLEREVTYYREMIEGKHSLGSRKYSSTVQFASDACRHPTVLGALVRDRKALVPQNGNCEGWGLSLNNIDEAIALCVPSVEQYIKQKAADAIAAEKWRNEHPAEYALTEIGDWAASGQIETGVRVNRGGIAKVVAKLSPEVKEETWKLILEELVPEVGDVNGWTSEDLYELAEIFGKKITIKVTAEVEEE